MAARKRRSLRGLGGTKEQHKNNAQLFEAYLGDDMGNVYTALDAPKMCDRAFKHLLNARSSLSLYRSHGSQYVSTEKERAKMSRAADEFEELQEEFAQKCLVKPRKK